MVEWFIFALSAFFSYWYETEFFLFCGGLYMTVRFLSRWYQAMFNVFPPDRGGNSRWLLGALPVVSGLISLMVLFNMASYDVTGIWIVFYLVLGYAWLSGGVSLLAVFDLSWVWDSVYLDNKAAVFPAVGGVMGLSLIYAGANTGDGPGWWTVFIAGGIGLAIWLLLGWLVRVTAKTSERITVERDRACGIRFGAYLLASGLILARASGGDWISFYMTVRDFKTGLPVLPLVLMVIVVERILIAMESREQLGFDEKRSGVCGAVLAGGLYLLYAVTIVLILPCFGDSLLLWMAGGGL